MFAVNPQQKSVVKIDPKKKPTQRLTTKNLKTYPLLKIETDSDELRTPAVRVTGINVKELFESETTPSEIRKPDAPFLSKVASQSRRLQ